MLDTGRGGHHEEVQTLTARGQEPGLCRRGTAATGGPAAPAQGPTAGDSSAGRTTVKQEEDMGGEEDGGRDKRRGERVRGPGKDREGHEEKAKERGNEKGWGGSEGKAQGEDRDGWRKTGKKFSSI